MSSTDLLERAKREGTPLIEGDKAIFVWEGETAPFLAGDFNGWGWREAGPAKLEQASPGVWVYTTTLPVDSYSEYIYSTDIEDKDARLYDPLNKRRITNGMGKFNHYFSMPEAKSTPLVRVKKGISRGTVTHHRIEHPFLLIGGKRDLWLYQPPVDQPAPLLLVYDGRDYLRRAKITEIVDNLIAQNKIRPIALAMIDNGHQGRFVEYDAGEAALAVVMRLVLPLAQENLNLIDIKQHPGSYGALGASLGGLMAVYTALRVPHIFGHAISQSGSFQNDFLPGSESLAVTLLNHLPRPKVKIWQDVGTMEWLLETNRRTNKLFMEKGYDVVYREYNAAHNYTAWRNILPEALTTIFHR